MKKLFLLLFLIPNLAAADLSIKMLNEVIRECNPANKNSGIIESREVDLCLENRLIKHLKKYSGKNTYNEAVCYIQAEFIRDLFVYKERGYSITEAMIAHPARRKNISKLYISGVRSQYESAFNNKTNKGSQQIFKDVYTLCLSMYGKINDETLRKSSN